MAHGELRLVAAYRSPLENDRTPGAGLPLEQRGGPTFDTWAHRRGWEQLVGVEAAVEREYPDLPLRLEALEGHAVRVLADLSADAALVVVGRHERPLDAERGVSDVMRGVLLHAHCPVAVVASGTAAAPSRQPNVTAVRGTQ
jgi:Universal stress protein family